MRIGCLVNLQRDVKESFREALELGFRSGQLVVWDLSLYTPEVARENLDLCQKENFELTAVWCGWSGPVHWGYPDMYHSLGLVPPYMRAQRVSELLKGAEFAHLLGVRDVVTHIGYFPDDPFDANHVEIVQCVRLIGQTLAQRGQRFLFETGEELPVTLLQLMRETGLDNLGVNFDPANLMMSGRANSLDALRMFRGCLYGVHAKDGRYPDVANGKVKGTQTPLGEGETQFREIVRMPKEFGYEGDITIEREIDDPVARRRDLAQAKCLLNEWMKEA